MQIELITFAPTAQHKEVECSTTTLNPFKKAEIHWCIVANPSYVYMSWI